MAHQPAILSSDSIQADLQCIKCDYNLKTLATGGACPECGTAVRLSIEASEQGGFGHVTHAIRARRLLKLLATAFACVSLVLMIDPVKGLVFPLMNSSGTISLTTATLYYWGDRAIVYVAIMACCLITSRLSARLAAIVSISNANGVRSRRCWIAGTVFAWLLVVAPFPDCAVSWMGFWPLRAALGPTLMQWLWGFAWWCPIAAQPLALACLAASAMFFCAAVASRSNRLPLARRYAIAGGVVGLMLLLIGVSNAVAAAADFIAGANGPQRFFHIYLDGAGIALETFAIGATALLVGLFSCTPRPSTSPERAAPLGDALALAARVRSIANAAFLQAIAALAISFLALVGRFTGPLGDDLLATAALILLVAMGASEIVVSIRLALLRAGDLNKGQDFRSLRRVRFALYFVFAVIFGVEFGLISRPGLLEYTWPVLAWGALVIFMWISDRIFILLAGEMQPSVLVRLKWFEHYSVVILGGLVLLYHLLIQTGRRFNSTGPTDVLMSIKTVVEYSMIGAAIWWIVGFALVTLRIRRFAAAMLENARLLTMASHSNRSVQKQPL